MLRRFEREDAMPPSKPGPLPLFDTALDRVCAALPGEVSGFLRRFATERPWDVAVLRGELEAYLTSLELLADTEEFLDLRTARILAKQCAALLSRKFESKQEHQLVQAAVRYFIEDDDAEGDTTSIIGFDDDAEVIAAVARELNRAEVLALAEEDD